MHKRKRSNKRYNFELNHKTIEIDGIELTKSEVKVMKNLYRKYRQSISISIYTFDDIKQEVLMKLVQVRESFDETKNIKYITYFWNCIENKLIDLANKSKRFNRGNNKTYKTKYDSEDKDPRFSSNGSFFIHQLINDEIIGKCIHHRFGNIIKLFLGGMNYVEISKQLGISERTVSYRFNKVVEDVRTEYFN